MDQLRRIGSVLAGGALLATLWAGGPVSAADPPVTLRLSTVSDEEGPTADLIRGFAQAASAASGGSVVVEPVWNAQGDLPDGGDDQALVARVTSGDLEMVLAASRGFDDAGTTALQALQAPFLITDDALALAVATGETGDRALGALGDAGLVGLAMWPDGLRHLLTFQAHPEPFLAPADLDGMRIRSVVSAVAWDLLRAYGAVPSQKNGFDDSEYDGEEQQLHGRPFGGQTAIGNVVFFPRYQVLAIDDAVFSRLTPGQQEALRSAAIETRDASIAAMVAEADAAVAFCAGGGRIVAADPAGVQAFIDGAAPVLAALEQDPATAGLVAAIRELKASTPAAPGATACEPGPQPTSGVSAEWSPSVPPDGVYRAEMTYDEVGDSMGTWTWTVTDGESVLTWSGAPGERCRPSTTVTDDAWRLTFRDDSFCLVEVADLRWEPTEDGIRVRLLRISPATLYPVESPWYDRDWVRIE